MQREKSKSFSSFHHLSPLWSQKTFQTEGRGWPHRCPRGPAWPLGFGSCPTHQLGCGGFSRVHSNSQGENNQLPLLRTKIGAPGSSFPAPAEVLGCLSSGPHWLGPTACWDTTYGDSEHSGAYRGEHMVPSWPRLQYSKEQRGTWNSKATKPVLEWLSPTAYFSVLSTP